MTKKLKECPFCGGDAIVRKEGSIYIAICGQCLAKIGCLTEQDAVESWNYRPLEDAKDERIKELKNRVNDLEKRLDEAIERNYENAYDDAVMMSRGAEEALKAIEEKDEKINRLKDGLKTIRDNLLKIHLEGLDNDDRHILYDVSFADGIIEKLLNEGADE